MNRGFYPDGFLLNGTLNVGDETDVGIGTLYGVENGRPAGTLNVGYHCHVDIQGMGYDPDDVLVYLDGAKLSDWAHKNGERGRILLSYNAYENGDFEGLYPIAAALPDPFVGRVCIGYPYTLQDNLNAYEDAVELIVDNGGSLTVPADKTLIARYMGNNGGNLIVNGTLVNTDRIELYPEDGSIPAITVAEGGKLIGPGEIDVRAQTLEEAKTWLIGLTNLTDGEWDGNIGAWVFYLRPDLMLPAMLTEIESEAFAGGAFRSVYIPESVTAIANNAFGDMQGLIILGSTDTARGFAESRGYTFVEYSPAA